MGSLEHFPGEEGKPWSPTDFWQFEEAWFRRGQEIIAQARQAILAGEDPTTALAIFEQAIAEGKHHAVTQTQAVRRQRTKRPRR
jgi:hypothetical protein